MQGTQLIIITIIIIRNRLLILIDSLLLIRLISRRGGFENTNIPRHLTVVPVPVVLFVSPRNSPADSEIQVILFQNQDKIPVGGRLRFFLENWKKITNDQWVLSVIEKGYKLEFIKKPIWQGIKQTIVSQKNMEILLQEVNILIEKDAIESVQKEQIQSGFYSTFFLVPKKNGKMRPVINLRPLKWYFQKKHFQDGFTDQSLEYSKTRRLGHNARPERCIFTCPNISKSLPISKILPSKSSISIQSSVLRSNICPTSLYKNSIRSGSLLENEKYKISSISGRLVNNKSTKSASMPRSSGMSQSLGIIRVHSEQRKIQTSSESEIELIYLGALFDLEKGLIFPTQEGIDKLNLAIQKIMKEIQVTALDFLHLLGIMASCIELIPNARLYMRPIQLHLLSFGDQHVKRSKH